MKLGLSKSRFMLVQVIVLAVSVINDVTFSHPLPLPLPHPPSPAPAHPPSQHHHHHHGPAHSPVKPPAHPPLVKPPAHPPVKPPAAHPPVKPPAHPPVVKPPMSSPALPPVKPTPAPIRSFIAVQGVVYCESCNYTGKDTLLAAKPISGAVVKLACNNTKYSEVVEKAKTDKKGYFFIIAPKTITNYAFHKCKVFLVYSPVPNCKKPANLNAGFTGAPLKPYKPLLINSLPFTLYSVGPFAFEPKCPPHTHL